MLQDVFCSDPAGARLLAQTSLLSRFLSPFLRVVRKTCFCLSSLERDTRVTIRSTANSGPSPAAGLCRGYWAQSLAPLVSQGALASGHSPGPAGRSHRAGRGPTVRSLPGALLLPRHPPSRSVLPSAPPALPSCLPSPALLGNELTQKNMLWVHRESGRAGRICFPVRL